MGQEYIICAAIWYDDGRGRAHLPRNIKTGIVIAGWRHPNCINTFVSLNLGITPQILKMKYKQIQGFLTSKGNFVDRYDGLKIAKESGQYKPDRELNFLTSEDIY